MKKVILIFLFYSMLSFAKKPSGLANIGNTCYQNASLQCLMNIKSLTNYMLNNENCFYSVNDLGNPTLAQEYINLIKNIGVSGDIYTPKAFCLRAFADFDFQKYTQQDAHEFVIQFLDRIGDENVKPECKINGQSVIQDMLFPIVKFSFSSLECASANKATFFGEGVVMLQLKAILEESLKEYTSVEKVDYHCHDINQEVVIDKTMEFYSAPEIFIFSLKRFYQSLQVPAYKINDPLLIPLQLDLSPYFAEDSPVKKYAQYELIGVTVHSGSYGGGHYWAYVKDEEGNWYNANDSMVTSMSQQDINKLQTQGYVNSPQETPYVLYYQRKETLPAGININLNNLRSLKSRPVPITQEMLEKELQAWGLNLDIFNEYLLRTNQKIDDILENLKRKVLIVDALFMDVNAIKKEQEEILNLLRYNEDILKSQLNKEGISNNDIDFYLVAEEIEMNDLIERIKSGSLKYTSFLSDIKQFKSDQEKAQKQAFNIDNPVQALLRLEVELSALKKAAGL